MTMNAVEAILSIDIGTTFVKSTLFDKNLGVINTESVKVSLSNKLDGNVVLLFFKI
jgi:sugar (pentulose or hexulose) kinase